MRLFSAFLATVRPIGIRLLVGLVLISGGARLLFSADSAPDAPDVQGVDVTNAAFWKVIQKAWHDREERVQSLKLIWISTTVESEEWRSQQMRFQAALRQRLRPPGNPVAKPSGKSQSDVVNTGKICVVRLFAFRGNRYRNEAWRTKSQSEATALLANLNPGVGCDGATIVEDEIGTGLDLRARDNGKCTFRELTIGLDRESLAVTPAGEFLLRLYRNGHPALRERNPPDNSRLTLVPPHGTQPATLVVSSPRRELWLDPARDYVVTREVSLNPQGDPTCEIDCEYQQAPPPLRWVPAQWKTTCRLPNGDLRWQDENRVVSWATGESGVPENLFHFECPDGTFIMDWTQNHRGLNKYSIMWHGVRFPIPLPRSYAESLELVKAAMSE